MFFLILLYSLSKVLNITCSICFSVTVKECDWLKSKIGNLQPLNMYYYRTLWLPPGANYLAVISGSVCNNMSNNELSSWMSQVKSYSIEFYIIINKMTERG